MSNKVFTGILASLLVAVAVAGCAAPQMPPSADGVLHETENVTVAAAVLPSEPSREITPTTAIPPDPERDFHMRIFENSSLLFSTWPGEAGSLQKAPNADNATAQHLNASRKLPSILEPLRQFWLAAPPNATIELPDFQIPAPITERVVLPSVLYLPQNGTLTDHELRWFLGTYPQPGLMVFAKRIPINITRIDANTVGYRIVLPNETNFSVPRSSGLQMEYRALSNGTSEFRFQVPDGSFDSIGCSPIPGTFIPPGRYVVDAVSEDGIHATRYGDAYEYLLQGRTVTMNFEFEN